MPVNQEAKGAENRLAALDIQDIEPPVIALDALAAAGGTPAIMPILVLDAIMESFAP